ERNWLPLLVMLQLSLFQRQVCRLPHSAAVVAREGSAPPISGCSHSFPHGARTSFQRDFENPDKQDERDLFAGAMIRMAEQLGMELPETREVASVLEKRKPLLM